MCWASKLEDDADVLCLIRSLPGEIVQEQVSLYRKRHETAVAAKPKEDVTIQLSKNPQCQKQMMVAQRFHKYCQSRGIIAENKKCFMGQ